MSTDDSDKGCATALTLYECKICGPKNCLCTDKYNLKLNMNLFYSQISKIYCTSLDKILVETKEVVILDPFDPDLGQIENVATNKKKYIYSKIQHLKEIWRTGILTKLWFDYNRKAEIRVAKLENV